MAGLWDGTTFGELVCACLRGHPDRVAFATDSARLTFAQVAGRVGRMVAALAGAGVRPGDGVAVLAGNSAEGWMALAATVVLGARYTALQPLSSPSDQELICDDAEIRTLVFEPALGEVAARLGSGGSLRLLALGPSEAAPDLLAMAEAASPWPLRPMGVEADPCALLYTGGTTGRPKGVVLPQRAFGQMVANTLADFDLPSSPRYLAASPITHGALIPVLPTLLRGGTVYLHRRFDPEQCLRTIERERITACFGVPTMVYRLLDHLGGARPPESLERFVYGAAPISPDRLEEAIATFGPVFVQFYCQTESGGSGTVLRADEHDPSRPERLLSCGRPMTSVRLEVQDSGGHEVAAGQRGEICLQGRAVMDGYWRLPDLTAEALRGGWLHTGDIATRDEEGFVTVVDRARDAIVTGGFTVFPKEIEDVLCSHPEVSSAAVIGVPDDTWGEAVKALVVARGPGGDRRLGEELVALVRRRKGPVHAPKSIELVEGLPLTPTGKPDKRALRQRYWAGERRQVR